MQNSYKEKIYSTLALYGIIFLPMWGMFIINNLVLQGSLNFLGITPRELSLGNIASISSSWAFHGDYNHIKGNSIILAQLLIIIAIFEKKAFKTIFALIFLSGLATWLIGAPNSVHVGASGLVFAIFGYLLGASILGRRWIYLLVILIVGGEFAYTIQAGLIPQAGVSFAAHFGGLMAGIFVGWILNKQESSRKRRSLKQWYEDLVWKIKWKLKK